MDKVFIFGSDKFCTTTKSMLNGIGVGNYEILKSAHDLQHVLQEYPDKFFLIDSEKIYTANLFTKYIKFLIPENGIERKDLQNYDLGTLEFTDSKKAIDYIRLRFQEPPRYDETQELDHQDKSLQTDQEEDDYDKFHFDDISSFDDTITDETKNVEHRDLNKITDIDEIYDHEMDSVLCDLDLKKG